MMEQELEDRLRQASKDHLLLLIQELTQRYPLLHTEIALLLDKSTARRPSVSEGKTDALKIEEIRLEEATFEGTDVEDDWNFGIDEPLDNQVNDETIPGYLDQEACRQRIEGYLPRLQRGEPLQALASDLDSLMDEVEIWAEQHDFRGALAVYGLFVDERLVEHDERLVHIFDKVIDNIMPILETLLSEASSNIIVESSALTPLLTTELRQQWLTRLFALWVRRLDTHYVEENIADIILNVAWSEDVALLRSMVQQELQRQPISERTNIVDFTQQYRTRTLEKFSKELPHM